MLFNKNVQINFSTEHIHDWGKWEPKRVVLDNIKSKSYSYNGLSYTSTTFEFVEPQSIGTNYQERRCNTCGFIEQQGLDY